MNKKNFLIVGLIIVIYVLNILNTTVYNDQTKIVPTNDKTWSQSSLFTNVSYQQEQKQQLKEEYYAFDIKYTIDDPYIKINPYGINPLSAYVIFETGDDVKYSYEVHSKNDETNFKYQSNDYSQQVIMPIIGLFENTNNKVTINIENKSGISVSNDIYIQTGNATYYPVKIKVKEKIDEQTLNGWYFDSFYNAFDIEGNIRYNLNVGVEDNPMRFTDGSFFVKVDNYQTIYELNIMGEILNTYKTPSAEYNFHHDVVRANNGYTYALASYNVDFKQIPYAESLIFKYDDSSIYPIEIFDLQQTFDQNLVSPYGTPNTNDLIHMNSIDYIEASNELLISSQSQSFIAALDADDGSLVWVIQDDEANIENKDKSLEIVNDQDFMKTSGQHSVFVNNNSKYQKYIDEGKVVISMFNNNNCKDDNGELLWTYYGEKPQQKVCTYNVSDVLIYAIDEQNKTVEQIDIFTIDNEYAKIMSSVFNTPSNNMLVHYSNGAKSKSYLIDNEGQILIKYTIKNYRGNGYYRTVFKEQKELITLLDNV